jgi:NAD-dependent DNA ligase
MCNCPEHTAFIVEAGVCYWCPNCQQRFAIEEMPGYGKPKAPKSKSKKRSPKKTSSTPTSGTASVKASKPKPVSFAISGVLPSGKTKAKFAEDMEKHGHTWNKSLSGGTRVLICEKNRVNSKSNKEKKAESMGIDIVTEKKFIQKYVDGDD